jgi:hypothetical protein
MKTFKQHVKEGHKSPKNTVRWQVGTTSSNSVEDGCY